MKQHVQVYTDNREGWIKAIKNSPEKATAHDILEPRNDRAVKTADLLFGRARPLDETAAAGQPCSSPVWHREVHQENSFLRGKSTLSRMWRCRHLIKTGKPPVSGSAR
ncbi:conjugal transfer nickase/helicase TraI [Klebsiella pneumoniae]|nr:conjugal transfer nickase/helicase TraI [Klebsiella pneumoniae]